MKETRKSEILTAARAVFLRYGYKRVNMNDIAEAANVSRPALYILFRNKEEIFVSVYMQWVDETLADMQKVVATTAGPEKKIERAFECWAVRPFEIMMESAEAKELMECTFTFAQPALSQGYKKFEAAIAPILITFAEKRSAKVSMTPETIAHVLASAVRGFKQSATTPAELRQLIKDLLVLVLA
jgi:AcrR family transcriptional regulator